MKKEIKVYEGRSKIGDPVPQIRLQGKWLNDLGFKIGTTMEVNYESSRIILTAQIDK